MMNNDNFWEISWHVYKMECYDAPIEKHMVVEASAEDVRNYCEQMNELARFADGWNMPCEFSFQRFTSGVLPGRGIVQCGLRLQAHLGWHVSISQNPPALAVGSMSTEIPALEASINGRESPYIYEVDKEREGGVSIICGEPTARFAVSPMPDETPEQMKTRVQTMGMEMIKE